MAFFIEKIVASGAGKKESTIVFKPGANIIYGPSNTGKTYIVIENEIPEIDYSNVNLIHFTKNANTGRYGFLIDVMD